MVANVNASQAYPPNSVPVDEETKKNLTLVIWSVVAAFFAAIATIFAVVFGFSKKEEANQEANNDKHTVSPPALPSTYSKDFPSPIRTSIVGGSMALEIENHKTHETNGVVGLPNLGGNDCWLNSLMQIAMISEGLAEGLMQALDKDNIEPASDFLSAYREKQLGLASGGPNTVNLRYAISKLTDGMITEESKQQDVEEAYTAIMGHSESSLVNMIIEKVDGVKRAPVRNSMITLSFNGDKKDFPHVLDQFFNEKTDQGLKINRKFAKPPKEMMMRVSREKYDVRSKSMVKVKDACPMPSRFNIGKRYLDSPADSNKQHQYVCDGFIVHRGDSLRKGHYVSYIKTDSGWVLANDGDVTAISDEEARRAMKTGYLYHYKEVSQNIEIVA